MKVIAGQAYLSLEEMALIWGVSVEELRAEYARQCITPGATFRPPAAWIRQGRATVTRLGTTDIREALRRLTAEAN